MLDKLSGEELGVAQEDVLVLAQVEIRNQVDFVADVGAGAAGGIAADGGAAGVIERVPS